MIRLTERFCNNAGRSIGARFPAAVGLLAGKAGLGTAIAIFSLGTAGPMILPLLVQPESLGRSSASLKEQMGTLAIVGSQALRFR